MGISWVHCSKTSGGRTMIHKPAPDNSYMNVDFVFCQAKIDIYRSSYVNFKLIVASLDECKKCPFFKGLEYIGSSLLVLNPTIVTITKDMIQQETALGINYEKEWKDEEKREGRIQASN